VTGVLFWCYMVDIPLWFSALVFCVYSFIVLFASRLVAKTGMVEMQRWLFKSHKRTTKLVGYKSGGTVVGTNESEKQLLLKPLGVFSMFYTPMLVGHHTLVNRMTGFRATETIRSGRRAVAFASLAALIVGSVVFALKFLDMTYQVGALNVDQAWYREVYHIYNNTLIRDILLRERSRTHDWTLPSFIGWGMAVMGFLV
jgi:hypothetical protein